MGRLTATCVWRISAELVRQLDERFGEPLDTYVNGSQVWMRDDGPGSAMVQWRLHPVASYHRPPGLGADEVFVSVATALISGEALPAEPSELWDGLEAFAAYDDGFEPAELRAAATASLGLEPDAWGLVDHQDIGDVWERARGGVSVVALLLEQLTAKEDQ
jgi:hypothetical protein